MSVYFWLQLVSCVWPENGRSWCESGSGWNGICRLFSRGVNARRWRCGCTRWPSYWSHCRWVSDSLYAHDIFSQLAVNLNSILLFSWASTEHYFSHTLRQLLSFTSGSNWIVFHDCCFAYFFRFWLLYLVGLVWKDIECAHDFRLELHGCLSNDNWHRTLITVRTSAKQFRPCQGSGNTNIWNWIIIIT